MAPGRAARPVIEGKGLVVPLKDAVPESDGESMLELSLYSALQLWKIGASRMPAIEQQDTVSLSAAGGKRGAA